MIRAGAKSFLLSAGNRQIRGTTTEKRRGFAAAKKQDGDEREPALLPAPPVYGPGRCKISHFAAPRCFCLVQ